MLLNGLVVGVSVSLAWLAVLLLVRSLLGDRFAAELEAVRKDLAVAEERLFVQAKELEFNEDFLLEFPHLCANLTSRLTMRQLPEALLEIVIRSFDPTLAVVVLRRKRLSHDGRVDKSYFVVACSPPDLLIKPGVEVVPGQGAIGVVIEKKKVMSRDDLATELGTTESDPIRVTTDALANVGFDLAAPMMFDEEVIGVLAASGCRRRSSGAKRVIRLIAQIAALTYYNVSAYRQMEQSADLDPLTVIKTKASITKYLDQEIVEAKKRSTSLSIILFDIDNFKTYNDGNGHLDGDGLLTTLAREVRGIIRAEDCFGRFGGDEFLLVLPETDYPGAIKVAEKVRRHIASYPFYAAREQPLHCVSISGGIANFPVDARDSGLLLRQADEALYTAKVEGRNRVVPVSTNAGSASLTGAWEAAP